jgi:SNF2 family DNA or RNA helicase
MPITLPPAEQAIYLELQQLLASSDFKMKKRKANNSNDKERRIRELLGTSESPGEALIKCASQFTLDGMKVTVASADDACNALVDLREKQLGAIKDDLQRKTEQADWLYRNCGNATDHYKVWEKKISEDGFGDPTSLDHMKEVLVAVARRYLDDGWRRFYKSGQEPDQVTKSKQKRVKRRKSKIDEEDTDDDDEPSILPLLPPEYDFEKGVFPRQIELRNVVNDLYKKCDELIARCRSLRYLDTIRGLQRSFGNNCNCTNCGKRSTSPEKSFILQLCGHILCNTCLAPYAGKHLQCLVKDCNAYHRPHEVLRAKELCVNVESTRIGRRYGQKIGQVVQLVESIPEDEQVLLFVQFEGLMTKFVEAFDESDISYAQLTGHGNTSKILEDFQTNSGTSKKKVLVLNMGDETAAGR